MKSIKFLAALAIPAMFAACTNEELVAVQDSVQQNKEFVGAELIGSDISINVGSGVESRLYGSTWSVTDQLGLGWVVNGVYGDTQDVTKDPTGPELFNNLMFYKESEEGNFTTKGNVYKGWYFAYYPYAYMEELGTQKTLTINPAQTEIWDTDRYNTAFYISGREFLSKEKLDEKTYQLNKDVQFAMYRATNTIGVTIKPSTDFTGNDILKKLAVKSIRIDAGADLFPGETIKVNPEKLAKFQFDTEGKYNATETQTKVKETLTNGGVLVSDTYCKYTTTEINNSTINLSGEQTLRIYTLPKQLEFTEESVVFTINVAGGHFKVGYVPDAAKEEDLNNNAVIEKFVAAYAEGGEMTVAGGVLYDSAKNPFKLMLTTDMFHADYIISKPLTAEGVTEIEQWNACVALADALNEENPKFTLKEGANVEFTTGIKAPKNGVTVVSESADAFASRLTINGELTWNPAIEVTANGVAVVIEDGAALNVEGVLNPHRMNNYGTINAGENATVGHQNNFDNFGRVIVEYGAIVSPNRKGTIAYVVPEDYNLIDINKLIEGGEKASANVNTLVVNRGITLVCRETETTEGTDKVTGRYDDVPETKPQTTIVELALNGINLEINGGTVIGGEGFSKSANNVVMCCGSIEGVAIAGNLTLNKTIESRTTSITEVSNLTVTGNATVECKAKFNEVDVEGAFEIKKDAEVAMTSEDAINIGTLKNYGTLNSNNNINVTDVELKGCTTTLESTPGAKDKKIWYTGSYTFENQTLTGAVAQWKAEVLISAIKNAEDGDVVTLSGDVQLSDVLTIDNDVTIDLDGNTVTFGNVQESRSSDYRCGIKNSGTMILKNGNIIAKGLNTVIRNEGVLDLVNVDIEADGRCVESVGKWTEGKTIDELRDSRSVYTNIIGGTYYSSVKEGHASHDYAIFGIDNSSTTITDATIVGDGGVAFECADGALKNVKATSECKNAYGAYIYDAGELIYDINCDLGTVYAQKYNSKGEYKEKYGKLIVNKVEVNKDNTTEGAFGGMLIENVVPEK